VSAGRTVDQRQLTAAGNGCKTTTLVHRGQRDTVERRRLDTCAPVQPPCNVSAAGWVTFLSTQGVKKCEIWHRLKHHSTLSHKRLKMQQDIVKLKQLLV